MDHSSPELIGVDDAAFTPDGDFLVVRDNTAFTSSLVYDGRTGDELFRYYAAGGIFSGPCEDSVVTTDDHAVVAGSTVVFIDLNNLAGSPYAEFSNFALARDLALTPDGSMVAVRGTYEMFLFDLVSGALLVAHNGQAPPWTPTAFSVDSVAVTDEHAVFTGYTAMGKARVTIFALHPAGGGPPKAVFETTLANDQEGVPHDIVITPDGTHAAVRSSTEVGLYQLSGDTSHQVWVRGMANGMDTHFGGSAMDSIVATDTVVATISRRQSGAHWGAQLDAWEVGSNASYWNLLDGDPHDLELTPAGDRLVLRTHLRLYLFDLANLPGHPLIQPLAEEVLTGNFTSWEAGLDSLAVTQDRVLAVSRKDNASKVRVYDISADGFEKVYGSKLPEPATDVAITPEGHHAVVSGETAGLVIDLRLNEATVDHNPWGGGTVPWCDGLEVNDEYAAVFGVICCDPAASGGWLSLVDLFGRSTSYCDANRNSTGVAGRIIATGSSRFSSNDLTLTALDVPAGEPGRFVYGDIRQQFVYGDGFVCIGGQVARFPVQVVGGDGRVQLAVDNAGLPFGGGDLIPGTTWNFQFVYRDTASPTATFNLTDAVSVLFE